MHFNDNVINISHALCLYQTISFDNNVQIVCPTIQALRRVGGGDGTLRELAFTVGGVCCSNWYEFWHSHARLQFFPLRHSENSNNL